MQGRKEQNESKQIMALGGGRRRRSKIETDKWVQRRDAERTKFWCKQMEISEQRRTLQQQEEERVTADKEEMKPCSSGGIVQRRHLEQEGAERRK